MTTSVKTSLNISNELRLLLYSLNATDEKQQARLENFLAHTDIDWNDFIKRVVGQHRVTGPVYKNLAEHGNGDVPDFVMNHLKKRHHHNAYQMLTKTAEVLKLTNLFKTQKIPALPFKGPVLGFQLYDDISMRFSSDIDIVISPDNFFQAEKALIDAGYRRILPPYTLSHKWFEIFSRKSAHFIFLSPTTHVHVELHWKFFLDYICPLTFNEIWKNRKTLQMKGNAFPSCAIDDTLILLLVHGAKHDWKKLFWANDIILILGRYSDKDWERFMDKIQQLEITRLAISSLVLIDNLFDLGLQDKLPAMALHDKKISFLVQIWILNITKTDNAPAGGNTSLLDYRLMFARFSLLPKVRNQIKYAFSMLSPSLYSFDYFPLHDRLFLLHYPLKPFAWFFRNFTWIKPTGTEKRSDNKPMSLNL